MIDTIKLRNDSSRCYNGIKPGQTVNVEDPTFYIVNGFSPVDQLPVEQKESELESKTKKELEEMCQNLGIEVPKDGKKADLIKLIEEASTEGDGTEGGESGDESDEDLKNELE